MTLGASIVKHSSAGKQASPKTPKIGVCRIPYPYQSMMAICSDLDETPDWRVYWEIARYLNTSQDTAMGPGVGLEVGNSIYFDMPKNQFSYWNTDDTGRNMVRTLIRSGHIDCLHSYGDHAGRREDAQRALDELSLHDCRLRVWVDHSKAPTNFGPDIMVGSGDVVGADSYHADLTMDYGIRYIWRGRTTGITGQDASVSLAALGHLFRPDHPLVSTRTIAKQAAKVCLGRRNHPRWRMHSDNRTCRPSTLRDGRPVWEFLRSNPYWGGTGHGDTPDGIDDVLSARMLNQLVRRGGVCILYTHLGKVRETHRPFPESACRAFRRLAQEHESGNILVTTTHRLLRYLVASDSLRWSARHEGRTVTIDVEAVDDVVFGSREPDAEELQGITFKVDGAWDIEVRAGCPRVRVPIQVSQCGAETYATVPWTRSPFPEI